jgi:TonB family protein
VLKKVRSTKKKAGAGKGMVVVGFSIAPDGGLAGVQVLQSSGDASLGLITVDHIHRSAPFPAPPPEAAGRGFSFEFVGR